MVQLGEYFTYEEMVKSDTAKSKGIDNTPDEASIENMKALVKNVLDPVRKIWGKPLTVNSGFRSRKLNEAIGGAKTSQHMYGMAADITTGTRVGNFELIKKILSSQLKFDQLINEKNGAWIHISYNRQRQVQRGQVLSVF